MIKINKNFFFFDIIFLMAGIAVIALKNDNKQLPLIGFILTALGLYMMYKRSKNRLLSYIMLIISMINICIGVNDFIRLGVGISEWQSTMLRASEYNVITAKALLLFNIILNLFLNGEVCEERDVLKDIWYIRKTRKSVAWTLYVFLLGILAYALINEIPKHVSGQYESVENPIYEYSILLFILAWLYSNKMKNFTFCMIVYAIAFAGVFLIVGDRSSASMYLIFLLVIFYRGKMNFGKMVFVSCGAILFFNFFAIIRHSTDLTLVNLFEQMLERGLYQDTASWAYYTSIAIVGVTYHFTDRILLFGGFLSSLLGIDSEYSSMAIFAREYSSEFYNAGGGIFPSHFMAWLRYPGVILSAIMVGILIKKIFLCRSRVSLFYSLLIVVFGIRWYAYSPTNLFRSVFMIGGLAFIAFKVIDCMLVKKKYVLPNAKNKDI